MMFYSLRARLWLSYLLLILIILIAMGLGLILALQKNPLLYRTNINRLHLANTQVIQRLQLNPLITNERIYRILDREAAARGLRILLIKADGTVDYDSDSSTQPVLPKNALPTLAEPDPNVLPIFKDSKGADWLYYSNNLNEDSYLVVSQVRPQGVILTIFRDELLGPVIRSGLLALVIALLLSLIIGQWISTPLRRIANSAKEMAAGRYQPIKPEGPGEIRQLAESFNEMAHEVQTSQQSQRDFIANVSHELKTPLTSVQGFAQAILDGTAQSPAELKQAAEVIYHESGRMHRLVLDLLTLSRLEAGTADLQKAPVDMSLLLTRVVDKFAPQAQKADVNLSGKIAALPYVIGDGDRLAQVFTNLVDNALKFTPPHGNVQVQADVKDGYVTIWVSDTGPGISADDRLRIFERFYQVDKARRGGTGRGVGLGLAIARQIVIAHGGVIDVTSTPGSGSTFYVRLPVVRPDDKTLSQHIKPGAN